MHRSVFVAITLTATALAAAGFATAAPPPDRVSVSAKFELYRPGARGITYDPQLVAVGAKASVTAIARAEKTRVVLTVRGLVPNRKYGSHAHQKPCGQNAADSGPHYQHVVDPVQPSVDPAYANPRNEIWLDFTTDEKGSALASSTVDWKFTDRRAGSVVIHAEHTHTEPGHAGMAGPRLSCISVPF
ncbi:superoxide dismutase family protein [Amycolatopsis nigrescens]|uniref:superoxide dismutase family protein n=1 Tax=Amycolatopsis nigrescens TaxID=381445 RepID=UPI000367C98D|nr:superoxide dismutase family protein [Amycolatopsis nigrescens]